MGEPCATQVTLPRASSMSVGIVLRNRYIRMKLAKNRAASFFFNPVDILLYFGNFEFIFLFSVATAALCSTFILYSSNFPLFCFYITGMFLCEIRN